MNKAMRKEIGVDKYFDALTAVVDAVTGNELLVKITGVKLATLTDALLELEAVKKENAVLQARLKALLDMSLVGGWGESCPSYERKQACRRRGIEKATADVCEKCWRNYAFEKLLEVQP